VNEKTLVLVHQFHDPARQGLANGVVAWQEQLAAAHPLEGLGLEADEMRKALAAAGISLPPPAAKYGVCGVGQRPVGITGACAAPPGAPAGCTSGSLVVTGTMDCGGRIQFLAEYLAGTISNAWSCSGDGSAGRCVTYDSISGTEAASFSWH
jgi:hypothetical protein